MTDISDRPLTTGEAAALAAEMGQDAPARTVRYAASHGFIPGAVKHGRDWTFPKSAFLAWLANRPKPGRK